MNGKSPKTFAESFEEFAEAWREFIYVLAESLGIICLLDWINAKLSKEDE